MRKHTEEKQQCCQKHRREDDQSIEREAAPKSHANRKTAIPVSQIHKAFNCHFQFHHGTSAGAKFLLPNCRSIVRCWPMIKRPRKAFSMVCANQIEGRLPELRIHRGVAEITELEVAGGGDAGVPGTVT